MIHATAIVDPSAELADDVIIGPYSIIGPNVKIDSGTEVGPHVVIKGPTTIGKDNRILQFASVGEDPQDKKYRDEPTLLEIGDRNLIREYCTLNRGTVQGGGVTRIGNDNWIMAYVHIAHDCIVGSNTIFANAASLAGHVIIEDYVILGGFTTVHQFCSLGEYSFTGMKTVVLKDVPPYVMASGSPAHPHGLNTEGLKRRGFSPEIINEIRRAYKVMYKENLKLDEARKKITEMAVSCPELEKLSEFLGKTTRGIIR